MMVFVVLVAIFGLVVPNVSQAQGLSESKRIAIAKRLQEGSVAVTVGRSSGSGFIVGKERWVITNAHVVQGYRYHAIELRYRRDVRAAGTLIALDPSRDLAVIRPAKKIKRRSLPLGDPSKVEVGQTVLAFGNPFGLDGTLTQGIVSAKRDSGDGPDRIRGLIQTDAPINPGNSGGPLVNSSGEVIGVNTAILSQSGGSHGIGFAVPVNYVRAILKEARAAKALAKKQGKQAPRAWLGISGQDFLRWGIAGAQVVRALPGSPAERSGIRGFEDPVPVDVVRNGVPWTGFIIVGIDGKRVRSMSELVEILDRKKPGERPSIDFVIGAGDIRGSVRVELGRSPPAAAKPR